MGKKGDLLRWWFYTFLCKIPKRDELTHFWFPGAQKTAHPRLREENPPPVHLFTNTTTFPSSLQPQFNWTLPDIIFLRVYFCLKKSQKYKFICNNTFSAYQWLLQWWDQWCHFTAFPITVLIRFTSFGNIPSDFLHISMRIKWQTTKINFSNF